jgi:hypothetical protein
VLDASKAATAIALAAPVLILALPLLETACVITRRFAIGYSIYQADESPTRRGLARGLTLYPIFLILDDLGLTVGSICPMLARNTPPPDASI